MASKSGALGTLARTGNQPRPKSRMEVQCSCYKTTPTSHTPHCTICLGSATESSRFVFWSLRIARICAYYCCYQELLSDADSVPGPALSKAPPALPHTRRLIHPPDTRAASPSATLTMIQGTRRWFKRNRTNFAIGAGVLGAGYLAGQYLLGKLGEARQRMSDDRIAKEKCAIAP